MFNAHMRRRNRRSLYLCDLTMVPAMFWCDDDTADLKNSAIRITPGMKLHPSFMGFPNHKFKRIIIRNRCFPLFAGQPFAPGFNSRREKSVACRSDLNNHGIHSIPLVHIELPDEFCFLLFCT